MWRPANETVDDTAREHAAAQRIQTLWGMRCLKLSPALYHIDWSLHRGGKLVAFAEYKFRDVQYESVLLSFAKFEHGCRLAMSAGVGFIFFVEFTHGILWLDATRLDRRELLILAGGNTRGQNGDIEPVIHLPIERFVPITRGCQFE